jgi:hypothetical protein
MKQDESGQPKALKWFTLVLLIFRAKSPEKSFAKMAIHRFLSITSMFTNYFLYALMPNGPKIVRKNSFAQKLHLQHSNTLRLNIKVCI